MKITASDIVAATAGRLASGAAETALGGVSTDSRTIAPGEVFFALLGRRFDGHRFLRPATEAGAAAVVISEGAAATRLIGYGGAIVIVADTTKALGDLAASYRRTLDCVVIAITGSCGKTSVKEMLGQVLETRLKGRRPESSFNNFIGVPLTIFRSRPDDDYLILELGTSAAGELRRLCEIARPGVGVVTCVGPTHLAALGGIEGVAQEKEELVRAVGQGGGLVVLNCDDPYVAAMADVAQGPVCTFGVTDGDILAGQVEADARGVVFQLDSGAEVRLPVPGRHNVLNALATVAVARHMGLAEQTIVAALARYRPPKMRLVREELSGGLTLIDDAYNANLTSSLAALEVLSVQEAAGRCVLVQGDMLELGRQSRSLHTRLGEAIAESAVDLLVTVGLETKATSLAAAKKGDLVRLHFDDSRSAAEEVAALLEAGDVVLVKGSRGLALEHVVTAVREKFAGGTSARNS